MEYLWPIIVASFWGPMLLHFKKSNEILETWWPHCKNIAFKDPPSLNFHNRTDATTHAFQVFAIWHWSIRNGCYRLINLTILTQRFHKFFFNFAYKLRTLLLDCHIGMLIPILKSLGSQNPKLCTQVVHKSIQNSTFGVVLDCYVQLSCVVLGFAIRDF